MPETSNNIIQKGLAFPRQQSGTVVSSGRWTHPGILPRRLDCQGGASVVAALCRQNRMEDP